MYFLKRNPEFKSICAFARFYSFGRKTHYDVLNLQKNCSEKEIKSAFIQMSKEYHPDKNKDVKAQEHFVRIVEAYNILSKPSSRAQYDCTIEVGTRHGAGAPSSSYVYRTHVPYNLRNNPQYSYYYEAQQKARNSNQNYNAYYGVQGVRKMPNIAIILLCFGIAVVGVFLQVVVIRESYFVHRKNIQKKSIKLEEELDKVRTAAEGKTNEAQSRMLLDKIVAAANASAATASLGQALADDKK